MQPIHWLPLRGRWLRYFVYGCAVLLILATVAATFPVMMVVTHQPPPGWWSAPEALPAPRP